MASVRDDRRVEQEIPNFSRMREWVSPDGVRWHRRGDRVLSGKDLGRQLSRTELRVLHHYAGELTDVPVADRNAFWDAAQERMQVSVHSEFRGVEFRSDTGERLLVVDEDC